MAALANSSLAQTSATRSTNAGAALVYAMTLTETTPLHFGSSTLTNSAGGTVILPSNSASLSYTGGVAVSSAAPGATNAGYIVTGTALETYALTLPASATITHTSVSTGVHTMEITHLKARFNGASADAVTSALSPEGTGSFTLGGTLHVGTNQVAGVYTGTFSVTIEYN